jgi:acyl transferase domain-containing protein
LTADREVPQSIENAIAIVGMAARVPGARNIEQFWRNLRDGVESVRQLTDEELRATGVDEATIGDPSYVKAAAILEDLDMWDAGFFGFSPKDAAIMDPQHRHFLECAWEAMEHAGHSPDRFKGPIGVFAGSGCGSYLWNNVMTHPDLVRSTGFFLLRHTGNDKDFLTTRVSYCFDLKGPSVNVQTACSTSLVAVHMGAQSLLNHECDMVLAGGVTIELPHGVGYHFKEGEILSPDGHCRPFEADSQGTVFGSGVGVLVLRRLEDALADGDTIHALVVGSAVNNDGSSKVGYLAPSVDGQVQAITEALSMADVPAETIGFIEAHGTGTAVGDPIEVAALTESFRRFTDKRGFCALGSVKSNIGHLDTAAGVAGIIKAILAMQHGEIPATLHYRRPNPVIDFANSPFFVNGERQPWPKNGTPRRAGISSLGVGGTNAHIVLQEAPQPKPTGTSRPRQLLLLSGRSRGVVERRASDLARVLETESNLPLADVAYTLSAGRKQFRQRRFVVARDVGHAVDALLSSDGNRAVHDSGERERKAAFLFAGGGAQYPAMGRDLYESEPVFRQAVDESLRLAAGHVDVDLRALLFPALGAEDAARAALERPSSALPVLFAVQYALARLWMSWGVKPTAMIGHSMGEYTAACLSGVFSLQDALAIVALRGKLFETLPPGAMTSVPLSAEALRPYLGAELSIAAINGPELCVASGPVHAIEALEARLTEQGVEWRRIHIEVAAHSAMLEPILDEFGKRLARIRFGKPEIPFVSNLSGSWANAADVGKPEYWVRHLRETVRFADGLEVMLADPDLAFVEVGPGRTLSTLAKLHPARKTEQEALPSMRHPADEAGDLDVLLNCVGRLWQLGVPIDWDGFYSNEQRRRVPLPTYPFEHKPYWYDAQSVVAQVAPPTGRRADIADWFYRPTWVRANLAKSDAAQVSGRFAVIRDSAGHADRVAQRLRAAGAEVVFVAEGPAPLRTADTITIVAGVSDEYERLVREISGDGALRAIVHLGNLGASEHGEKTFFDLLYLARALARVGPDEGELGLYVVTDGMQAVLGDEPMRPEQALVLGPVRVMPREMPNVRTASIDVAVPSGAPWKLERLADQIAGEALAVSHDRIVAYRGSDRLVERFEQNRLPPADPSSSLLRPEGVYLITGGLGGIGRTLARHLAARYQARLILVGRRGLPPRNEWETRLDAGSDSDETTRRIREVLEMERAGATVIVEDADVTDAAAMQAVVRRTRERFGALHGVFHAAGVLADDLIVMKSEAEARRVLGPKVRGALALVRAVEEVAPDFVVFFSSRSAVSGLPGQIDYTAANAFLDALAHSLHARTGIPAVSIGWDLWQDVGMAADLVRSAGSGGNGEWEPLQEPLFDRWVRHSREVADFVGDYAHDRRWLLDEHRIRDGERLIPGSGFIELARAAYTRAYRDEPIEMRDVMFVAPFSVSAGEHRELRVRIAPNGTARKFTISGRPGAGETNGDWNVHARGLIGPTGTTPRRLDIAELKTRCRVRTHVIDGIFDHPHLDLGPRWGCLRSIAFGTNEALLSLELPEELTGDLAHFALHPAMVDLATAGAQELVEGFDAKSDFYIPGSYGSLVLFRPLPRRFYSHVRYRPGNGDKEIAIFDVTFLGEDGTELADIQEFVMFRVADRRQVRTHAGEHDRDEQATTAGAPLTLDLADAIRPDEGMEALERLLTRGGPRHALVVTSDLNAALAALEEQARPAPARERKRKSVVPAVDVSPLEQELERHEAIREAAALAHQNGDDDLRVAAFVVYDPRHPVTVSELRRFLRQSVEERLIPNSVIEMHGLPRLPDGTIDRAALPNPYVTVDDYVGPRTPTERAIADIWKDLLGAERVSIHDNFLDIGGHSLIGVRVLLRIEKATGVRIHPNLLTMSTLEQIAAECARTAGTAAPATNGAAATESLPESAGAGSRGILSRVLRAVGRE